MLLAALRNGSKAPWLTAAMAGVAAPAAALVVLAEPGTSGPQAAFAGPVLAIALMAVGMITASASGRIRVGVALALAAGAGLILSAQAMGAAPSPDPRAAGLALIVASTSFAVRGGLFARSSGRKGWWIAVAVVAGEAAVLFTAAAAPGALPGWLLALLPAQWASAAIDAALYGRPLGTVLWELLALSGTAAATLLVAVLWPRRWPYLIMFGTWISLSTLVWHRPPLPLFAIDTTGAEAPAG